ncbi:MAG TPA: ABC transporter substrate-binding protein [Casimicrobiaceae bacterium]|nr:ABC transporter substrate-binding protein [Casimicrobiaceae bacterium]
MASADAGKLDPHLTATTPDKGVLHWMFNGLVRFRPGTASPETIEPDIAESWSSNPTATEWTFKLRQGVQCHHNYGEFTSADAVYSIKRASTKATSSFSNDFNALDSVTAPDKYTVKVTLKNPVPGFLGYLANYHGGNMVCMKAAEEMKDNFAKKPVGTGPFEFADYQPQQFVKLKAHAKYFRGAPALEEIVYRYIPSDATRDLAFQSGELDLIYGKQDQTWVERMRKIPGAVVGVMEPAEMSGLYLNTKAKPLDDLRVRQAIAHAIDRKGLVDLKGSLVSRPTVSVVPSGYLGTDEKAPLYPHDIAKAKALLAEAGYPNGVTVKTIHTTLPGMQSTIEAVQAQLKKAGITLDIELVEHATFHAKIREDLSPIVHYAAARFPVADVYLTQFYHSRSQVKTPTAVTNFTHCSLADKDIEAARVEPDAAKQKAHWKSAQEKLVREVCGIGLHEQMQVWAWRDTLDLGYELKGALNLSVPITEKTRFKK